MKQLIYLMVLIVPLASCKKLDEYTQFEMDFNEKVVIPSSSGINLPFNIFSPDVESNSESTFAVNDTRKDLIEKIVLTDLELRLTSPSNSDFSFLESIQIYISAEGLSELKIAWKENINGAGDDVMILETLDQDLQEYIKAESFQLRVNAVTDEILTSDHHINIHTRFFVDAVILGQ